MTKNPPAMAEVIDRLFYRLECIYGPEWTRQCGARPIGDIKTLWGSELARFMGDLDAIAYAVDNLPERCPNIIEFKNLCRAAPAKAVVMLPEPKSDPQFVAEIVSKMKPAPEKKDDGVEWARGIVVRKAEGEYISPYVHKLALAALATRGGAPS